MQLPATGAIFEQKYEILDTLGAGGFAKVYRARDVELGRDVAIKVLEPRNGDYAAKVVARFMVEARVIAQLRDAHTIRLFEFGKSRGGLLYMVFQYVAGEDLSEVMKRAGAFAPETVVHIAKQLLSALAEAHELGVLHRDIKPGNILVHEYMNDPHNVKLLDFGIAKVDETVGGVSLTKTGALLGTPRYMSPEQVFAEPLHATTDIYSLGLVMYEMLVGRPALEGSQKDVLTDHAAEKRHFLPEHVAWPELRAVIERMLAHDPRARYQTATETAAALDGALAGRSAPVRRPLHSSGAVPQPAHGAGEVSRSSGQHVVGVHGSSAEIATYGTNQKYYPSSSSTQQPWSTVETDAPRSRTLWFVFAAVILIAVGAFGVLSQSDDDEQQVVPTRRAQPLPADLLKDAVEPVEAEPTVEAVPEVVDAGPPPEPIDLGPSEGCGTIHPSEGERWIDTGVAGRGARVYLPDDYDPDRPHALLMGFGPKYESEGSFAKDSGLAPLAVGDHGLIGVVVSPANRFDPWEDLTNDRLATRGALDQLKRDFCIDPTRVFALGHHDGGLFLRRLACDMPLAGIALSGFAEKVDKERCDLHPYLPTLVVAGRNDDFIPAGGGRGCTDNGPYRSIEDHEEFWAHRYGCAGEPSTLSTSKTSKCRVWNGCDAPLAMCRADGGHHLSKSDWTLLYPTCRSDELKFALADEAWAFFEKHGRPILPGDPRHRRP